MAGQPITAEQREQCVEATAGRLHDAWRELRRLPDGGYEPRLKSDGFGGQVDIANTDFPHLPAKWQAENRAATVVAATRHLATSARASRKPGTAKTTPTATRRSHNHVSGQRGNPQIMGLSVLCLVAGGALWRRGARSDT